MHATHPEPGATYLFVDRIKAGNGPETALIAGALDHVDDAGWLHLTGCRNHGEPHKRSGVARRYTIPPEMATPLAAVEQEPADDGDDQPT